MGLDVVEFVIALEEAFGLRIPNDVAASLTSPRRVIDYVHGQLPLGRQSRRLSRRSFEAVRQALSRYCRASHSPLRSELELLSVKPLAAGWSWQEVATVVDGLIRYHFGIGEYSLDDRFVEELGLD